MRLKTVFLSAVCALGLAACSTAPRAASSLPPQVMEETQIQAAMQQVAKNRTDYKIQSGDLLDITVYQEKDMDRTARVSGNGIVTFPLAGNLKLAGLSVPEAEAHIASQLSQFLINPQVSVLIKEYGNKQVYVLGEVKKPGSIEMPVEKPLTVLEAVTLAGGFSELAAPDRTKVLRTENGKSVSIEVQISRITKLGDKNADIPLNPSDVVFVPQSYF